MKILITSLKSAYDQRENISQYQLAFKDIMFTVCKMSKELRREIYFYYLP